MKQAAETFARQFHFRSKLGNLMITVVADGMFTLEHELIRYNLRNVFHGEHDLLRPRAFWQGLTMGQLEIIDREIKKRGMLPPKHKDSLIK